MVGLLHLRDLVIDLDQPTCGAKMRPLHFVQDAMELDDLKQDFLTEKSPIFAVLDKFGGFAGVVSWEDLNEEIMNIEFVEEKDVHADLRQFALEMAKEKTEMHKSAGKAS